MARGRHRIKRTQMEQLDRKEGHYYYSYSLEAVAVVPEVVLGVHGLVVEDGVLAPLDDLVPQNHLVHLE